LPLDPAKREKAVTNLLDAWPWDLGGIIIGGYVNAAYGKPRYSNDVDFVLPVKNLGAHLKWLHGQKPPFVDERIPPDLEQNYAGRTARLVQGDVTLDLLPGGVMDREAKVLIPEHWIAQKPRKQRLLLLDSSTKIEVRICRPEAFWALKLQAGRKQDLGDLMGIVDQPVDFSEVRELFVSLSTPALARKLAAVRTSLDNPKILHDVLSVRMAGSPTKPTNQRDWERFKAMVYKAIPEED